MTTTATTFKKMNALYAGKCKFCGQVIQADEPILYYFQERRVAHDVSQKCRDYKKSIADVAAYSQMIARQEQEQRDRRVAEVANPLVSSSPVLEDGYYTVVFDFDGETRHKTFRVFTGKKGNFGEGKQMVAVFLGTDNTDDKSYQAFAFLNGKKLSVWKRFALYQTEIAAVNYLLDSENAETAGILYATESGNCRRCNRLLTNPKSVDRGYGPTCVKKI